MFLCLPFILNVVMFIITKQATEKRKYMEIADEKVKLTFLNTLVIAWVVAFIPTSSIWLTSMRYIALCWILAFLIYMAFIATYSIKGPGHHEQVVISMSPLDQSLDTKMKKKEMRVAYLKVPKTGSSTLACILLNFGIKNNLSMYLPRNAMVSGDMKNKLIAKQKHFDIFAIHAIYDYTFFTHIVQNPVIIGSVRDPLQRLISHIFYVRNVSDDSDENYMSKIISNITTYRRFPFRNIMANFFGLKGTANGNQLKEHLNRLNREFSLIVVLERFNESLVLLKRLLRWSLTDIFYGKKKVKNYDRMLKTNTTILNSGIGEDIQLYNFFVEELNKKVKKAGHDFIEEVKYFEEILHQATLFCDNEPLHNATYIFPPSKWEGSLSISADRCETIFKSDVYELKKGRYTDN